MISNRFFAVWVTIAMAGAMFFMARAGKAADKDLRIPAFTTGEPAPGRFVKQVAPEYEGTGVYHGLYLPEDWRKDKRYPVIVEYAGNLYPPICTGKIEDCKLGFYQSGGKGYIWVVMPYVNSQQKINQLTWWGDVPATVDYCKTNLKRICERYGGDTGAIFLTGFSRGAIACGYIGLQDDEIADLWLAFLPHSHHDGGSFTASGADKRLARIAGRPSFITYGSGDGGKPNSLVGKAMLEKLKYPVQTVEIPGADHTDLWIVGDSPERRALRAWMADVLKKRPGTFSVQGKVLDDRGKGMAGVRVQGGALHWTFTDEKGEYILKGLISGDRILTASKDGYEFTPKEIKIQLKASGLTGKDFSGAGK